MREYIIPFRFSFPGDGSSYMYSSILELNGFASYETFLKRLELSSLRLKGGPNYQSVNMQTSFGLSISSVGSQYPEMEQSYYKRGSIYSTGINEILSAYNVQLVYPYDAQSNCNVGLTVRPNTKIIMQAIAYSSNVVPIGETIYLYGRLYFQMKNPFERYVR